MSTRIHYIDPAHGDDANDGLSPARPVRNYTDRDIRPGDTVLFKRGSVVRGPLETRDGAAGAPVTYGAYGDGAKPAFLGSVAIGDPAAWIEVKPRIWRYTARLASEVCNLVFNDGQSCGFLRWELADLTLPGDWHYTGIGMHAVDGDRGDPDGVLYLCSAANPGTAYAGIECVLWGARRMVGGNHVILEHLSFRNAGVHGYFHVGARNVVIRNCEFRFIGGAVWSLKHRVRFGNGVELWDGASDCVVAGCVFDNIYDSAVTHQGGETRHIPERLYFRDNLFVDCGLSAYESREPAREVYFEHNTCINSGGGFSMQGESPPRRSDPYPQSVGYHVFIFHIDPGTQPGPVYIRHNLFYRGSGPAIAAVIEPEDAREFVIDRNAYGLSDGQQLAQYCRLPHGMSWREAIASMVARGTWPLRSAPRVYMAADFGRYQAETGQDAASLVACPQFVDAGGGDYRQRADSPCLGYGMREEQEDDIHGQGEGDHAVGKVRATKDSPQ